jgi:glycosyltransferase involved in cell wall biosynthesis
MKIIQIVTQMEAGGAQRISVLLGDGLSGRGHVSKVWFLYVKRPAFSEGDCVESLIRRRPSFFDYLFLIPRLARKIITTRPDVVITHTHYANVLGQLVAFACGVNVRIAVQHNSVRTYPPAARVIDAVCGSIGVYSKNVLVSPSLETSISNYPRAYKAKTTVIRNGVPEILQKSDGPDVRQRLGIPQKAPMLVHAGRLSKQKNQEFILNLLPGLSGVHAVLIGDGELRHDLARMANGMGIARRVHFTGEVNVDAVYSMLQAGDIFLFPSLFEAMPLAMIDAMMCGLPIIASDIPSAHEILGDAGLIIDLSDKAAWLEAIQHLSRHAEVRASVATQAKERARRFTSGEMTWKYESLIFQAAGENVASERGNF